MALAQGEASREWVQLLHTSGGQSLSLLSSDHWLSPAPSSPWQSLASPSKHSVEVRAFPYRRKGEGGTSVWKAPTLCQIPSQALAFSHFIASSELSDIIPILQIN